MTLLHRVSWGAEVYASLQDCLISLSWASGQGRRGYWTCLDIVRSTWKDNGQVRRCRWYRCKQLTDNKWGRPVDHIDMGAVASKITGGAGYFAHRSWHDVAFFVLFWLSIFNVQQANLLLRHTISCTLRRPKVPDPIYVLRKTQGPGFFWPSEIINSQKFNPLSSLSQYGSTQNFLEPLTVSRVIQPHSQSNYPCF